jgi:AGCS family alanine or glycine:cation symporter
MKIGELIAKTDSLVWSPFFGIPLLLGTGVALLILLKAIQFRKFGWAAKYTFGKRGRKGRGAGDLSPFQALWATLAATVGVGNIVGVATAITLGGPGALFWIWICGLLGMGTKYAECTLGIHFRKDLPDGTKIGGPFVALEKGAGKAWLGILFSIFALIASLGIGNMSQANSLAYGFDFAFGIPKWITGIFIATLAGVVIIGGVKRIGKVTEFLVPFMCLIYVVGAIGVLIRVRENLAPAIAMIFHDAFTGTAAKGGFLGSTVLTTLRYGVARGIFSNEAGLGSAPMAHSAAKTEYATRQGLVSMIGPFIDTIIVCTFTGLAIISTGAWVSGEVSTALTQEAFSRGLGMIGPKFIVIAVIFFAFSTVLTWSFYARQNLLYLCEHFIRDPKKFSYWYSKICYAWAYVWVFILFVGAVTEWKVIWDLSDVFNGLMMVPNLIGIWLLAGFLKKLTAKEIAKLE